MSPYHSEGTLTTDRREIAVSETWDTWSNPQSMNNVEIVDGSVQLSEIDIPDSAVFHANAQNLSGFTDGDVVSTWPDDAGGNDATATGDPVYRESSINGHPSVEFDGSDDYFSAPVGTISQPMTTFVVLELQSTVNQMFVSGTNNAGNFQWTGSEWTIFSGNGISGSTTSTRQLVAGVYDGTSSIIREDGSETVTGDAGGNALDGLNIGRRGEDGNTGLYSDARVGLVEIHDGMPTDGLTSRESEIANAWDITLS